MCTGDGQAGQVPAVLHDFEPEVEIVLEPVDSVVVTTLMDNVTDALMPDQGPARRVQLGTVPVRPAASMAGGQVPDALIAEHGFSVLVTVTKAGREHRFYSTRARARTASWRTCGAWRLTRPRSRSSCAVTATLTTPPGSTGSSAPSAG